MTTTEMGAVVKEPEANEGVKSDSSVKDVKTPDIPYGRFREKVDEVNVLKDALDKFRVAEKEAQTKELEKKGEYDKIIEDTKSQLKELSLYKEKWENYEKSERESLLGKLTEEQKSRYASLPIDTLKSVVGDLTTTKVTTDTTPAGVPIKETDISKMTHNEKLTYYANKRR